MQVRHMRRAAVSLLVGGLVAGLVALVPAGPVEATAPVVARAVVPLDIVVLGDSYSAGNGSTDAAGQEQYYGPADCYRSRVGWAEMYAAGLRQDGAVVNVANHACSGGKAADIVKPRVLDTASRSTRTPAGVTTIKQANAYLARQDFCNTGSFPAEEFWTYVATAVDASMINYDCTRKLRPQARFITPETDLVLFTMGGNDAGFTTIVTQCFIAKSGSGCQDAIDTARSLLPSIRRKLLVDIDAIRNSGLRADAKIVQLGYPYLQTDNGYAVPFVPPTDPSAPTYAAGDAVRSLIDDGTVALAGVATAADVGHPGQMRFVSGIKEAFAGHEPDATTAVGNPDRWVNQTGDGTTTSFWYHPNRQGQIAYARVLSRGGDYGATPPTTFRAVALRRRVTAGQVVRIRTIVTTSDGRRPRGRVLVRQPGRRALDTQRVDADGRTVLRARHLRPGRHRLKAVYVRGQRRQSVALTVVVRRR